MVHQLPAPNESKPWLARIGLGDKPSRAAEPLRIILTFLKEAGSEQVKQLPGIGPALAGYIATVEKLSNEEAPQQLDQRVEQLLNIGQQTQDDIEMLNELSAATFYLQLQQSAMLTEVLSRLKAADLPAEPKQLTEFSVSTALVAYRSRIAREYQYADHRGIDVRGQEEHVSFLPLNDIY